MMPLTLSNESRATYLYIEVVFWQLERMKGNPLAEAHLNEVLAALEDDELEAIA
jgi:hypothetical protein